MKNIFLGAALAAFLIVITTPALAQDEPSIGTKSSDQQDSSQQPGSAPASQLFSGPFEQYVAFIKGKPKTEDAQVSATYSSCLFCATTTANQTMSFDKGDLTGIRWAGWWKHFGFAAEWSYYHASNTGTPNMPQASFSYQALSMIPMLRVTAFPSEILPGGRLNLYGGIGLDQILPGTMDVSIPPNPPFSTGIKRGFGSIVLIGASLNFRKVLFLLEWRTTSTTLESENWGPGSSATIPVSTNGTIFGVAYRF